MPGGIALAWVGANEVPQIYVLQGGALVLGALVANEWLGWREREGHYRIQTLEVEDTGDQNEMDDTGRHG
jgi:hypothetical protein